jgi:hypothetical protein
MLQISSVGGKSRGIQSDWSKIKTNPH